MLIKLRLRFPDFKNIILFQYNIKIKAYYIRMKYKLNVFNLKILKFILKYLSLLKKYKKNKNKQSCPYVFKISMKLLYTINFKWLIILG